MCVRVNPLLTKEGRRKAPGWSLTPKCLVVSDHPSCALRLRLRPIGLALRGSIPSFVRRGLPASFQMYESDTGVNYR